MSSLIYMAAFQKESLVASKQSIQVNLPRSKSKTIKVSETEPPKGDCRHKKQPPLTFFNTESTVTDIFKESPYLASYLFRIIMRKMNARDQTVSTYSGWRTHVKKPSSSTVLRRLFLHIQCKSHSICYDLLVSRFNDLPLK